jgi:hypothetical protein
VRDLYCLPRLALACFAFLFPSLEHADTHLVQEPEQERRWQTFQRHFAQFYERCKVIAPHLAEHIDAVTDHHGHHTPKLAWKLLASLLADENKANSPPWEVDDGKPPKVTWGPSPVGGAFAVMVEVEAAAFLRRFRMHYEQ